MATINAMNKSFTGTQFGVAFVNGVGSTDDAYLISRFKNKGYEVEEEEKEVEEVAPEEETDKKKTTSKQTKKSDA